MKSAFVRSPLRITPACAGISYAIGYVSRKAEDHPRMRGDKYIRA